MVNYRDEFEAISSFQSWLSSRNFFRGAKSTVMQISFVMLLFSDQISGRGKVSRGGKLPQGGAPCPRGRKPESLTMYTEVSGKKIYCFSYLLFTILEKTKHDFVKKYM